MKTLFHYLCNKIRLYIKSRASMWTKVRSTADPCTIQALLSIPLGVFNNTPCTSVDLSSNTIDIWKYLDIESGSNMI